jgi:hypothetical protein
MRHPRSQQGGVRPGPGEENVISKRQKNLGWDPGASVKEQAEAGTIMGRYSGTAASPGEESGWSPLQ